MKVLRSLRDIWVPNKITKAYVSGQRTQYIHPFRFYFICLVVFFGLVSLNLKNFSFDSDKVETLKEDFQLFDKYQEIESKLDSLNANNAFQAMEERLFDENIRNDSLESFYISLGFLQNGNTQFSERDLITLKPDSIFKKYNIEGKLDQFSVRQTIKIKNSPDKVMRIYIGNMLWGIILITILMSLVLKLLYIRHKSYVVEHFLHVSHFHCLLLLLVSILLIINLWQQVPISVYTSTIGLAGLYFFYSLKRYYSQGFFKMFIKANIIVIAYTIAFSLVIAIIFIFTAATI